MGQGGEPRAMKFIMFEVLRVFVLRDPYVRQILWDRVED